MSRQVFRCWLDKPTRFSCFKRASEVVRRARTARPVEVWDSDADTISQACFVDVEAKQVSEAGKGRGFWGRALEIGEEGRPGRLKRRRGSCRQEGGRKVGDSVIVA